MSDADDRFNAAVRELTDLLLEPETILDLTERTYVWGKVWEEVAARHGLTGGQLAAVGLRLLLEWRELAENAHAAGRDLPEWVARFGEIQERVRAEDEARAALSRQFKEVMGGDEAS